MTLTLFDKIRCRRENRTPWVTAYLANIVTPISSAASDMAGHVVLTRSSCLRDSTSSSCGSAVATDVHGLADMHPIICCPVLPVHVASRIRHSYITARVTRQTSRVKRHASRVTRQTSHVKRHASNLTRQTSRVTHNASRVAVYNARRNYSLRSA